MKAFLFGCTEPDRNPATYLKGSLRCQWLRGHNWDNARRYIARLCRRLERRKKLGLADYYALGKLIHYTVDAFTSAHNAFFSSRLQDHRSYEQQLHTYFITYLQYHGQQIDLHFVSVMDTINAYHAEYARKPINVHTDSHYCVLVTSIVVCMLHTRCFPGL